MREAEEDKVHLDKVDLILKTALAPLQIVYYAMCNEKLLCWKQIMLCSKRMIE